MEENRTINKRTVASAFAWKLTERFFSQFINLLIQIILARLILPEYFGSLALIVAITNFASIFVNSGISIALIQKKDLDKKDVSTVLTMSLGIAIVLYIILFTTAQYISSFFGSSDLVWPLRVAALGLILNSYNSVQTALLTRALKLKELCLRTIIAIPIAGSIGIGMALAGFNIWALIVYSLTNVLVIVIYMNFYKELRVPFGFSFEKTRVLYKYIGNIMLTSLITSFHDLIRSSVIGKKYSKKDLAYYDKAYTYSSYVTLIVNATLQSVLLPVLSRSQDNADKLKQISRLSVCVSAFIMIPILSFVGVTAETWIPLLLTERWSASIPFMAIFCIIRMVGCIVVTDRQAWYAIGRSDINLYYEIGLFVLNICTLLITMQYGVLTIAKGAMTVELIGCLVIFLLSSHVYNYSIIERIKDLHKPIISSLIMVVVVSYVQEHFDNLLLTLIVCAVSALTVYLLSSFLIKDKSFVYLKNQIKETFTNNN